MGQKLFPIIMVDHPGDILGHFHVLHLIFPHRHHVRIEQQDVRGHQHRIGVKPHINLMIVALTFFPIGVHRRLVGIAPGSSAPLAVKAIRIVVSSKRFGNV